MKSQHALNFLLGIYIFIFLAYLFGPLIIMSITAFNSAEFPAITPWECFSWRWFQEGKIAYDGQHLAGLSTDWRLHDGLIKSLIIGLGVVVLAVPIGMAASIVLTQVHSRLRTIFYSVSIMPVLFPGVIIGISTVVLWDRIATIGGEGFIADIGRNGIFLTILGQTCFISTYCFLIFVARLQRFDQTQEEAALDLGASQTQVFFKILIPYLMPAIASSAVIAFLALFEIYPVLFATPLILTTLSYFVLKEKVSVLRWSVVLIGFIGVLTVSRPGTFHFTLAIMGLFIGSFILAINVLIVRFLANSQSSIAFSFYGSVTGLFVSGIISYFNYVPVNLADLFILILCGILGGTGGLCISGASKILESSVFAPIQYVQLVVGFILGYLFFKDLPDKFEVIGSLIIVSSGLFLIYRENKLRIRPLVSKKSRTRDMFLRGH